MNIYFQRFLENASHPILLKVCMSSSFVELSLVSNLNHDLIFLGECVHLENCPALKYIHENQLEIYMKRVFLGLSNAACGHRDGKPLVCCREPRVPETTPAPTTPAPSVVQTRNPLLPVPGHRNGECGFDIVEKIYGGNKTKIDEFPWMALIQFTKRELSLYFIIEAD